MARKMGRNLKRAAAGLMACAAIALCAVSPAWGEDRASDVVNVTVPTRIDCALGADGTVTSPGGLEVVNNGPQDLYVGASTVDDFGQKVEFAMDLGGSPLLSRAGGKDVEGEVEFAGSSRKGLGLAVSKLNRTSHAALMDAAAQGEAPMFTVGFRFTFKALQGSMAISGEAKLGKTLTATVSGAQADAKLAYRWYRDGQLIAGAESASYTTNDADLGKKLKCEAYDAAGRYVGGVSAEVGPIKGAEAFAVFSADDGSLNFYKRSIVPAVGSQFEGKTVTSVYTGFEDKEYKCVQAGSQLGADYEEDAIIDTPWHAIRLSVKTVEVVDKGIKPISLQYWFSNFQNCTSFKLNKLDTTNVTSLSTTFNYCRSAVDIQVSTWNVERVKYMTHAFLDCRSLNVLDLSGWNTPNNYSLHSTWNRCRNLTELKLGEGWDTSKVTRANYMFYNCRRLKTLDLNNFDTSNIREMTGSFNGCSSLSEVKLGNRFNWSDTQTRLPIPNASAIPGADGYWYDVATGEPYKPEEIPSNKAATYVAVNPVKAPTVTISGEAIYGSTLTARVSGQPADTTATSYQWQYYSNGDWRNTGLPGGNTATLTLTSDSAGASCEGFKYRCVVTTTAGKKRVPQGISQAVGPVDAAPTGEAFAVYSAYDKSLNFYKRTNVPSNGDWYDGRTVTEVYTDIETTRYYAARKPDWLRHNHSIKNVRFFEPIRPISTSYWFYGLTVANIDLSKLCTSSVTDMSYMFYNCSYAPNLEVSHFNTSNVTNMDRMFYNCSSVSKLDLSNFDTSNVTNMNYMFGGCSSLTTIDMSGFDTSNVSNMDWMYSGCSKLKQVTLGAKFAWKSTYGYLPTPSGGQWYAASDGRGYAPEDIPSNKADTYYASKSLLPVTADEAPEAVMPDVEPCGDAAGTGADPEVEADAIGSEAVVPGEAENEESERKPDEDVGAGSDGDEKLDESGSEMASAAASPPEEDCLVPVTSDEAQ